MSCKKSTLKKYLSRPSPPYPAGDCPGQRKKGSDGAMYQSVADKRGIYRWQRITRKHSARKAVAKAKAKKSMTKKEKREALEASRTGTKKRKGVRGESPGITRTFYVEDNGIQPFQVQLHKGKASVYAIKYGEGEGKTTYEEESIYQVTYKHIWLGDNYLSLTMYDPPGRGKGNSILLQTGKSQYVYIGHILFSFDTGSDEILEYYSPIGNSGVPYPYAVGKEYVYFMLDEKKVPVEALNVMKDGYQQFYLEVPEEKKKKFKTKRIAGRQF